MFEADHRNAGSGPRRHPTRGIAARAAQAGLPDHRRHLALAIGQVDPHRHISAAWPIAPHRIAHGCRSRGSEQQGEAGERGFHAPTLTPDQASVIFRLPRFTTAAWGALVAIETVLIVSMNTQSQRVSAALNDKVR